MRQISLGSASQLTRFNKRLQGWVVLRGLCGEWVLGSHRAKADPHNGIGAGGEHIELTVLDELALSVMNGVRESKAYAFTAANPVFLHGTDSIWPTIQLGLYGV